MNDKKLQQWIKWHKKGYKAFMLTHLGIVLAFYTVTGTIAYIQLHMNMPESIKEQGTGVPILPAILIVGIMTPLSIVWSHFTWKRNESEYKEQ
ncbi:MAG: hypothetical protein KAH23_06080 [Kiritimatiellae bacterium]|nr:hypothetical protein [Kiritimatiellia bacterium]